VNATSPDSDPAACERQAVFARRRHREVLVISAAVIVLAFLLEVHAGEQVAFRFLPGWPLPETCPSRRLLHVNCPGCGLTRSFVYLAHGNWRAAWKVNRVGILLALLVVLQVPYRLWALCSPGRLPLGTSIPKFFGYLLVTLLLVNWLANLILRLAN
jgi:hypothetical protein